MENFDFYNPVKIFFGKGKIAELGQHIPKNAKILMTYGGGSIKKNGIYDQVKKALQNHQITEFGGIEPNPHFETLMKAVKIVQEENIDFLLPVGGGSVLDGTKFIAAAACYQGEDAWHIVSKALPISKAISIGAVLTLAATGSEMNCGGVITKVASKEKLSFRHPLLFPRFSVLDPETTYSLPMPQIANGIVDTYVHVMEQYLTYPVNSPVQDRFSEGLLLTLIEEAPKAMAAEKPDYENRANLMWAASMALNGLIAAGVKSDWATHMIGHELTALHGLDHAVTLAITLPGLLTRLQNERAEKLLQYAERIWGITKGSEEERKMQAIEKTEGFFKTLGIATRLSHHGISENTIHEITNRFRKRNYVGMLPDLEADDVLEILKLRL